MKLQIFLPQEMPKTWDCPGRVAGQDIKGSRSRSRAARQGGRPWGSWAVTSPAGRVAWLEAGRQGTWLPAAALVSIGKDRNKPCPRSVQEIKLPKDRTRGRQAWGVVGAGTESPGCAEMASWTCGVWSRPWGRPACTRKAHYCTEGPEAEKDLAHESLMVLKENL